MGNWTVFWMCGATQYKMHVAASSITEACQAAAETIEHYPGACCASTQQAVRLILACERADDCPMIVAK